MIQNEFILKLSRSYFHVQNIQYVKYKIEDIHKQTRTFKVMTGNDESYNNLLYLKSMKLILENWRHFTK